MPAWGMSRTLIVTGGSRGIGAAVVAMAAARGWNVCFSWASAQAEAAALAERTGALAVQADAATEAGTTALFAACEARFGPADAVVASAGITGPVKATAEQTEADLNRVMAVNVTGTLLAAGAFARVAAAHPGPKRSFVALASVAARTGGIVGNVVYAASKGALVTAVIGLGRELAPLGIRVNAVGPGLTATDMLSYLAGGQTEMAAMASLVPLGALATPEEVADPILYLLSDGASHITGSTLYIAGGR